VIVSRLRGVCPTAAATAAITVVPLQLETVARVEFLKEQTTIDGSMHGSMHARPHQHPPVVLPFCYTTMLVTDDDDSLLVGDYD